GRSPPARGGPGPPRRRGGRGRRRAGAPGGGSMNFAKALLGLGAAALAQMLLGQHAPALAERCDLFTIFTVYAALTRPPRTAVVLGSAAGLLQDALTGVVLGLNGFKKTLLA